MRSRSISPGPSRTPRTTGDPPAVLIGLTGPAGSGKDTIARHLCEKHGFVAVSFAGPLKDAAAILFGVDRERFDDRVGKEAMIGRLQKSPRELLQWLGTDAMRREFGPNEEVIGRLQKSPRELLQWLGTDAMRREFGPNVLLHSMDAQIQGKKKVVVSDVRFDNEAEFVKYRGGKVWRVSPEGAWFNSASMGGNARNHASESGIKESSVDDVVVNAEDLSSTMAQVDDLIRANGFVSPRLPCAVS
ncbi:Putative deoxynucleotide monophosphate kinase (DNK) (dNMP kinase) [Durusdinium trenchii]|uniref:Deoxynucleotide monophosphate kinase (DNK) (DNMP kinase) n=1 Tax=Durusdinium trenchii TaxID=1381693 RepID=A0ABP0LQR8_9DINO